MRTLLLYRVDVNVHSLPSTPPNADGQCVLGFTPLELAAGDDRLVEMLTAYCGTLRYWLLSMKGRCACLLQQERDVSSRP